MRLFKRKVKELNAAKSSGSDKVAGKIAGFIVKAQTKFADVMNRNFSGISTKRMKIFLFLFCLVSGGLSIYYIVNAVFNHDKKNNSFKIDHVDVPKHYDKTGDELIHSQIFIDEETMQNIQVFKQYMDSLKTKGAKQYDSIMLERPGLMDSITMLEEIYYSQKIK
jgi:hypothetical protein